MIFGRKKNKKEEAIPLGYVKGELYTELTLDNRAFRATIVELKRQIDNCEYMKNHVIAENTLKIQELDKAYGELSDEYSTLIREHDALLIDKGNIQKELDRLRAILREKNGIKIKFLQFISRSELEFILKEYYDLAEVKIIAEHWFDVHYQYTKKG
jgi:hypothetical protein